MTETDLKKLSRTDLLEMLIDQSVELQDLRQKYEQAQQALASRELSINNAGSIAEAALQVSGVFEAAQVAAQQYLDNIKALSYRQESVCAQRERESQERMQRILETTARQCEKMELETKVRCAEMMAKAKAESEVYWETVSKKLDAYCDQHNGLREMLTMLISR